MIKINPIHWAAFSVACFLGGVLLSMPSYAEANRQVVAPLLEAPPVGEYSNVSSSEDNGSGENIVSPRGRALMPGVIQKGMLAGWCLVTSRKKVAGEESILPAFNQSNGSCECESGWQPVVTGAHGLEENKIANGKPDNPSEKFFSCIKM